jgi:glutathione S-transferase
LSRPEALALPTPSVMIPPAMQRGGYRLHYWPTIQGRGEFVRLVLEDGGAPYVDVARLPEEEGGGEDNLVEFLGGPFVATPPYAPPVLVDGELVLAQTATICRYLAGRHRLAPDGDAGRLHADQLQLTIADLVAESHDVHHPVSTALYFEDQREEAGRAAEQFRGPRLEKYLGYLERTLSENPSGRGEYLVGGAHSYVDLSAFQLLCGLEYAFPSAIGRLAPRIPRLRALRDRVAARPRVAAYLASPRRIPFNEDGIFRHYPELDPP